ncbi:MAG: MoaD/ThiS family protein [Chloroflexi bacterium]|nr:MoaD/ThiS family protein [Chloroflexota bacterium]
MAVVYIPPLMRGLTGGVEKVTVPGTSLRQVIESLEAAYPGLKERLLNERGDAMNPSISVAVDGEIIRLGLLHTLQDQSEVHFLPAISGG